MSLSPKLKLDWCSVKAARYACGNWHYSKCLPVTKINCLGVWEDGNFIGVVVFSLGAGPKMGASYGLKMFEYLELARVALREHRSYVSRIISIALTKIKERYPKMRLVISFADTNEGHHGGIYQAGNWIYTGITGKSILYKWKGKFVHARTLGAQWGKKLNVDRSKLEKKVMLGKYRYLWPLDKKMRKQIKLLHQPYPKRPAGEKVSHPANQSEVGGSIPTAGLDKREQLIKN